MRLIDKVEIAYFRSMYKDGLSDCAETNIVFGRNDSGKSNILRALNLFLIIILARIRTLFSIKISITLVELKRVVRAI